jgi:hypothetical protein
MRVHVEACWGGGSIHYFRLTLPDGRRERVRGERWDRATAATARDILQHLYHIKRHSIRFRVR